MGVENRKTALLLVDFINPFDFPEARRLAGAALRAARQVAKLKARVCAAGYPVIYANDNFGEWTSDFFALVKACEERGGVSADIARLLQPRPGDLSVLKPRQSAFYGTPLEFVLEDLEVSRLIVTGLTTDICVFATAQDAHVRQYDLWIPRDCVAAFSPSYSTRALEHMARTLKAVTRPARGARRL